MSRRIMKLSKMANFDVIPCIRFLNTIQALHGVLSFICVCISLYLVDTSLNALLTPKKDTSVAFFFSNIICRGENIALWIGDVKFVNYHFNILAVNSTATIAYIVSQALYILIAS